MSIIDVMPENALLSAQFTATSMIALTGIIVRNAILLEVFINQEGNKGTDLNDLIIL